MISDSRKNSFISKAIKVHGEKYSYEKVVYTNSKNKVIITCPIHGDFEQLPTNHLTGYDCKACSLLRVSYSTKEFVAMSQEIHGEKYSYEKVVYTNRRNKVTITCPTHGDFEQAPYSHLGGAGCIDCSGLRMGTKEQFVLDSIAIHGEKYSYEKVVYTNSGNKVTITCPTHGDFEQAPHNHKSGHGCDKCGGTATLEFNDFIENAAKMHEDRYDYSKISNFKNKSTKIEIICRLHGSFWQTPENHLHSKASGCKFCQQISLSNRENEKTNNFIKKATIKHGNLYDYNEVKVKKLAGKIKIICRDHGFFYQAAYSHLRGHGCPKCSSSWGEREITKFLVSQNIDYTPEKYIKNIGYFDFVIINENEEIFIEFHGKQHYLPIKFHEMEDISKVENFTKIVIRDKVKQMWCEKNNLQYFTIPFWEIDRIPEILEKYLSGKDFEMQHPPEKIKFYDKMKKSLIFNFEEILNKSTSM